MAGAVTEAFRRLLREERAEANCVERLYHRPADHQALLSRAVDAQITDAAVARGVVEKLGNRVVISSDTLIYPVLNGFGVKKGNMEVKNALEEALKNTARRRNMPPC